MPTVNIPAAMRPLTNGEYRVEAGGATLADVIANLEAAFPGISSRIIEGDGLRPGMAVFVDGVQSTSGLRTRLKEDSEIYFAPAIAGG
jgi:molybdopterin synthase sulfur carrier subunit